MDSSFDPTPRRPPSRRARCAALLLAFAGGAAFAFPADPTPEEIRPALELALCTALNNPGAHLGAFVLE